MMAGKFRHRIAILERETIKGPHGTETEWNEVKTIWGRFVETTLDGRNKFEQIGYSNVSGQIQFTGKPDIDLSNRFEYNGNEYEPVEPLSDPEGTGRISSIVVRIIPQEG